MILVLDRFFGRYSKAIQSGPRLTTLGRTRRQADAVWLNGVLAMSVQNTT